MAVLAGDGKDGFTDMLVGITEDGNPGITPALSWYTGFESRDPNDGRTRASVGYPYTDVFLYGERDMSATVSTVVMVSYHT